MSRSSIHPRNDSIFDLSMYCSETRQWTKPINNVRLPFEIAGWQSWCCRAVVSNRVAYWLRTDNNEVNGIVAFEPFKGIEHLQLWRVINMPIGFGRGQQTQKEFVRLGLVRGRLRMSQLSWVKDSTFALKVWELIYNNEDDDDDASHTSWLLVHDLDVDMEKTGRKLSVIAFHLEIGDVIFVAALIFANMRLVATSVRKFSSFRSHMTSVDGGILPTINQPGYLKFPLRFPAD